MRVKKNVAYILIVLLFMVVYLIFWNNEAEKNADIENSKVKNYCFPKQKRTIEESLKDIDISKTPQDIFSDIFESSDNQKYIDKRILFKTMKFMIEERDEEDPELISFVRDLIVFPNHEKRNLENNDRRDFSQIGQSKYIDGVLKKMTGGFFVEAGGYDGESHSNSLFFELERNWTGLLIEPIPSSFKILKSKKRKCYAINACIANKKPTIAKFNNHNVLSGRVKTMNKFHIDRINSENKAIGSESDSFLYVPCFSLLTILKALDVKRIDYFSLDVEGGELDVLNSIAFDKIQIDTFTIEHNNYVKEVRRLREKMVYKENYQEIKFDSQDIYLKRRKSFF